MPGARRRVENWHGAVASDTARESGLCTSGVIMSQGFTVHPPYSCAPGNVQDECLTLMGVHLGGPRPTNCACWRCGPDQDLQSAVFGYGGGEGLRRTIAGAVSGVVAAVASHEHAYARSGLGNGPDWRRG